MIPDKIFCDDKDGNEWGIWFNEPAGSTDVAYIRKEALIEWAKDYQARTGRYEIEVAMEDFINKLNSM